MRFEGQRYETERAEKYMHFQPLKLFKNRQMRTFVL